MYYNILKSYFMHMVISVFIYVVEMKGTEYLGIM